MDAFLGEVRMFGGNFAPRGWALCAGQLMAISQNETLYALIGTTYGGDGVNTFGLPDLRGRIPVHQGSGFVIGQLAGSENVTLTSTQIPVHSHLAQGLSGDGTQPGPAGNIWATSALGQFSPGPPNATMGAAAISPTGSTQPHSNMMPFLGINFIIALEGIFPSQN